MSILTDGVSNVEGSFAWEDELIILEAGSRSANVIFVPEDESYDEIVFEIGINVLPRRVYLKFENELRKKYDGNDVLELPSFVVGGVIDKEVYVSGNIEAKLASAFIGENVSVNLSGLELRGDKKDNYYLDLNGFVATIHPDHVGRFGQTNDKLEFKDEIYVPVNSILHIEKKEDSNLIKNGYVIKEVYELGVKSGNEIVDISGNVSVGFKIDKKSLGYRRIALFNYSEGEYKEIEYSYTDGYLFFDSDELGLLVIAQKKLDFWWLYIVVVFILIVLIYLIIRGIFVNRKKINKYKSLKRRRDYGNY